MATHENSPPQARQAASNDGFSSRNTTAELTHEPKDFLQPSPPMSKGQAPGPAAPSAVPSGATTPREILNTNFPRGGMKHAAIAVRRRKGRGTYEYGHKGGCVFEALKHNAR
jgi:hypothetical protein